MRLLLGVALAAALMPAAPTDPLVVRTETGVVQGFSDGSVNRFHGIPYAKPPIGDLRWAPPERPEHWQGVRDATQFGPACPQAATGPLVPDRRAEDCLYLNVTTPARGGKGKPVMVWLHGGGFNSGAGELYDPARIATHGDVVVVTVNYRLGALGFLAHPRLGANFGLQDQVAALRWVRQNARGFGGNPRNVTVFGQSAGAMSVCALTRSPQARGLVDRAIVQSGTCSTYWPKHGVAPNLGPTRIFVPRSDAETTGAAAVAHFGCDQVPDELACLRGTDAEDWVASPFNNQLSLVAYDTDFLPEDPATAAPTRIPMIIGNTRDEMRLFAILQMSWGFTLDEAYYRFVVGDAFTDPAPILSTYPVGTEPHAAALAWSAVMTDAGWTCPSIADSSALNRPGRPPVYGYVFNDRDAPLYLDDGAIPIPTDFPTGALHGAELPILFVDEVLPPAQETLARQMIRYWTRFAWTGDPNGPGLPRWAPNRDGRTMLGLDTGAIAPVDVDAYHCDLW
ncbi:carboxylesterase/lipase family protein [Actinophytocola sp.]|uniref:carboxylesterase/lipase family protein n=1 Tax=Actinophytocola sp. TaxID=1872138 RepID=UPI002ECFD328